MIFIWIARNLYEIHGKKVDFWGCRKKENCVILNQNNKN